MAKTIEIQSLKSVKHLIFEMPEPGVWLLTGENGAGKTTLLACLHRLGDRLAFPRYFQTSNISDRLDEYSDAKICFSINEAKVEYRYSGTRWAPKPKKNASLVNGFGYSSVLFIGADTDRISPKPEDFKINRIHSVKSSIKIAANSIFCTDKFNELRMVNVTRGQNQAFVFKSGINYYSEKNFSLGELCTLKMLSKLQSAPPNSLVVIDELEMALHPSAQVRLYNYLNDIANNNGHTIIFSTHSVSLIKTADRKNIIFLKKNDGEIEIEKGPYLSSVLGGLAYVEEKSADAVIYVEDEMAEACTRSLVKLVSAERIRSGKSAAPKVEVVPIGGYMQVVAFLKRHDALHRASVRSFALLDKDVEEECLKEWRENERHDKLAMFDEYKDRIQYLPWTAEVGLVDLFLNSHNDFLNSLRMFLDQPQLQFGARIQNPNDPNNRRECKKWVKDTSEFWVENFGLTKNAVAEALCNALVSHYFKEKKADAMQIIGPLIS